MKIDLSPPIILFYGDERLYWGFVGDALTQVHLLGQVALLAGDNRQSAVVNGETCPMRGSSFL
jgi:hypothetical protein